MSQIKRQIELENPKAFAATSESPTDTADQCASADWEMFIAAVWREEDRLLREEGAYHVEGVYYANDYDASIQRRWVAEKIVRENARTRERFLAEIRDMTNTPMFNAIKEPRSV